MGNVAVKNRRRQEAKAVAPTPPAPFQPRKKEEPLEDVTFSVVGFGTCPNDFNGLKETDELTFRMYDRRVTFRLETPQRNEKEAIVDGHFVTPSKSSLERYTEEKDFCFVCFHPFDIKSAEIAEIILTRIEESMATVGLLSVGNVSNRVGEGGSRNIGREVGDLLSIRYLEVKEESNNFSHWGDALYILAGNMLSDDGLGGRAVKRAIR